jgi:kumamolisin
LPSFCDQYPPLAQPLATPLAEPLAQPLPLTTAKPKANPTFYPFYWPENLAKLYNFPTTYKNTAGVTKALDGDGKKIGIIQLGGSYQQSDLDVYFGPTQPAGIVRQMPNFQPYTYNVSTGLFDEGKPEFNAEDTDNSEVALDMQIIGALVPKATINIYFGYNVLTGTQYFYEAVQQAIFDDCSVISISWGNTERTATFEKPFFTNLDALFQSATTGQKKITFVVAAGDYGSSDDQTGNPCVDFPGSSPYVLSCGGTNLLADYSKKTIFQESVWNNKKGGATGGGVSKLFNRPTWQKTLAPKLTKRGLPDVTGHADPRISPYAVYFQGPLNPASLQGVGGTSATAPLYASLALRLCQAKGSNLGLLQPLVYANVAKVCRDITLGDNDTTPNLSMDFAAVKGWDACSGCGALNGQALFNVMFPPPPKPKAVQHGGKRQQGQVQQGQVQQGQVQHVHRKTAQVKKAQVKPAPPNFKGNAFNKLFSEKWKTKI